MIHIHAYLGRRTSSRPPKIRITERTLPEEMLAPTGWKEGNQLSIELTKSGAWILKREG